MKHLLIFILSLAIGVSAHTATQRKSSTQKEIERAIAKNKKAKSKKTRKISRKTKRKRRKIASVDVAGIKEQITALEARPRKNKRDYIAIADLYTQLKNYDKAIANLKSANKPQAIDVLDRLSRVYHLKGDYEEEVRSLDLIRVDGKASPSQLTRLGEGYNRLGKTSDAITVYRESIKKDPDYENAYRGLFNIFIEANNFYDARLVIIEVLEKFGNKKFWLTEFCRIEIEQSYFDNAKTVCQKAISKDPKNPDNHVYLALAYKHTEAEDQARKILFRVAKQFKKSEVTQWNAGQMSCGIKNWEQASAQFRQCLKADSQSGRCLLDLGKTQYELKKYDEALATLMKACPYIKGIDVEIRRLSYDLEKNPKNKKLAQKYMSSTDRCSTNWFNYAKKNKKEDVQKYSRVDDQCFQ